MITVAKKKRGRLGLRWGGETGRVDTVLVPGAMHVAPHSGESHIAVVPATLRDPLAGLGVSRRSEIPCAFYRISGRVAEYVARVRFPADATSNVATLVHEVDKAKMVAESVMTVV